MKNSVFILFISLLVGVFGFMCYEAFHKEYVTVKCPDCDGTGKASCGAPDCLHGTIPCPNPDCLQLTRGDWTPLEGHPNTLLWHKFYLPDGRYYAWSQLHVGQVIKFIDGSWQNLGLCPVCNGKGRVECPVCHGQKVCPTCHGKRTIEKEVQS